MKLVSFEFAGKRQAGLVDGTDFIALHSSLKEILANGGIDVLTAPSEHGRHGMCGLLDTYHA